MSTLDLDNNCSPLTLLPGFADYPHCRASTTMPPIVILIRHAQALHNVNNKCLSRSVTESKLMLHHKTTRSLTLRCLS